MKVYSKNDFSKLEKRDKANLFNCFHGFKSPVLIGTKNSEGVENLAIFSNIFHIGANPHFIGFISRPDSVDRHTLENIRKQKFYTLNFLNIDQIKNAHQTSARYEKNQSEFTECSFDSYYTLLPAPYVLDSNFKLGLELKEVIDIKLNGTHLIVGECLEVISSKDIESFGLHDVSNVAVNGLDRYYKVDPIVRFSYAKSDREVSRLDFN